MAEARADLVSLACARVRAHDLPAYVKDGKLRYAAVNEAFARLFDLPSGKFEGLMAAELNISADTAELEERERRALVFGTEETAIWHDPIADQRHSVLVERFVSDTGQFYVVGLFDNAVPQKAEKPATEQMPPPDISVNDPFGRDVLVEIAGQHGLQVGGILDLVDAGLCVYDDQHNIIYANAKMMELYSSFIAEHGFTRNLKELAELLYDSGFIAVQDEEGARRTTRQDWIEWRLNGQLQPHFEVTEKTTHGRWLRTVSKALGNGLFLGLRIDVTALKEAEQELTQKVIEAEIFKAVLDDLPVAAFVRARDHRLISANRQYAYIVDKPADELMGTTQFDLFGPAGKEYQDADEQVLVTGETSEFQQRILLPDQKQHDLLCRVARAVSPDAGAFLIGTITDISDLKQREEQLIEARLKTEALRGDLERLISAMPVGVVIFSKDLIVEYANEEAHALWGWPADMKVEGCTFGKLVELSRQSGIYLVGSETDDEYVARREEQLRSAEVLAPQETRFRDGKSVLMSSRHLSDGRIVAIYTDLSTIRAREREIDQAQEQLSRLGQFISDATRVMSQGLLLIENGRILLSNDALPTMLQVPPHLLMPGALWTEAITYCADRGDFGAEFANLNAEWTKLLASGEAFSAGFLAAGKTWVHMEASPNGLGQWTVVLTDMTDMKRREEELKIALARSEAADRAKSDFLANVSHEIRTPMNGVLGMAELLAKTDPDPRQRTFIDVMVKSGKALMTIINDILDFSTMEAGQLKLANQHFDPVEAAEDVAMLLSATAFEKDLEIFLSSEDGVPATLVGDAGRLRQILTNIVGNAIRFTEKGHVLIDIASKQSETDPSTVKLILTVEDTGIGISKDMLPSIFDKFHQVDTGPTKRHEGMGLGLSVTKGLVELYGGSISVESELGRGTAFTVELPFSVAKHCEQARALPLDLIGRGVLVVHSDPLGRELLTTKLSEWGFEAVAADDARMAVEILNAAVEAGVPPAAVIVDDRLVDMTGTDAVALIHHRVSEDMPAILLSSLDTAESGQSRTDRMADTYVLKPIRFGLLRTTLIEVLRTAGRSTPGKQDGSLKSGDGNIEPALPASGTSTQEIDVLVAEDNEINKIFFSQILREAGLRFTVVGNGADAVQAWETCSPALILMDVSMPVMNGFEAARLIREREQEAGDGAHVPIIGVTAHALERDRDVCLHAGMDDHMAKPIVPTVLLDKIHSLLNDDDETGAGLSRH